MPISNAPPSRRWCAPASSHAASTSLRATRQVGLGWSTASHIGARYGDGFQLIRELARGTRARVFLGSDGRAVEAVKVHRPANADRADREYRVGHALDHPNLVTVRRRFELDGAPAVAMPLVPGPRLSRWVHGAARDARLEVLDRLLGGLAALHEAGFVHRDVKPENVLYAVGVILYHWLTGALPFESSAAEIVTAHRERDVPLPPRGERPCRVAPRTTRGFDRLKRWRAETVQQGPSRIARSALRWRVSWRA